MKTCHYCAKKMKESDLFCPRCGREYRDDFYFEKRSLTMEDKEEYTDSGKVKIPKMRRSPDLFALLIGIFLILAFPGLAPLIIIFYLARMLTNKKRGK